MSQAARGDKTFAAYILNECRVVDCCKSFMTIILFCYFRCVIMPLTGVINYVFAFIIRITGTANSDQLELTKESKYVSKLSSISQKNQCSAMGRTAE